MMDTLKEDIMTLRSFTNDRDIIEQKVHLRKRFGEIMDMIRKYGEILKAMAKEKTKTPKVRDRRVKQGHQWLELTNEELIRLAEDLKEVDTSDLNLHGDTHVNDRREQQKNKRRQRRERRQGTADDIGDGIVMEDMTVGSEKEQMFLKRVEQSRQEEEQMLELLSEGLTELHELALTLNTLLKQSAALIEEVDEKLDRVTVQLESANKKMEKMLEETGGMTRWCPVCICAVILLGALFFLGNKLF
jgi:hypothetical protein